MKDIFKTKKYFKNFFEMKFIKVFNFFIGMSIGRPHTSMEEALELLKVSTESQLNYMKGPWRREMEALDKRLDENSRRVQQGLEENRRMLEQFEEEQRLREQKFFDDQQKRQQKRQRKRQRKRQQKMDSMSKFDD